MSYSFRDVLRCKFLWAALACVGTYALASAVLPRQPWLETVRIVQATAALVALVAFSYEIWHSITRRRPDRVDALTVAAGLKEFSFLWIGIWLLLFRLSTDDHGQRAYWMIDTAFFGLVGGWIPAVSSIMVAFIPGVFRSDPETGRDAQPIRLVLASIIAGTGLFAVLVVLAARPDAHALVDALRPWTP
jgi:hypothetical protein